MHECFHNWQPVLWTSDLSIPQSGNVSALCSHWCRMAGLQLFRKSLHKALSCSPPCSFPLFQNNICVFFPFRFLILRSFASCVDKCPHAGWASKRVFFMAFWHWWSHQQFCFLGVLGWEETWCVFGIQIHSTHCTTSQWKWQSPHPAALGMSNPNWNSGHWVTCLCSWVSASKVSTVSRCSCLEHHSGHVL